MRHHSALGFAVMPSFYRLEVIDFLCGIRTTHVGDRIGKRFPADGKRGGAGEGEEGVGRGGYGWASGEGEAWGDGRGGVIGRASGEGTGGGDDGGGGG